MCAALITPPDLSGLTQWLRADLGVTLNAGNVSAWADQSGNGNNVAQATATRQPLWVASEPTLNDRPCLQFDGALDFLDSTALMSSLITVGAGTIFCVARMTTGSGGAGMVTSVAPAFRNVSLEFAVTPTSNSRNNDGAVDTITTVYILGEWKVFQWRHGGGVLYQRQTLGTEASVASGNTASLAGVERIGSASTPLNGQIAEVVIYDRELTVDEVTSLMNDYFIPWYMVV